ncbi:hypothetical protein LTR66_013966 [Elasticomyces elasticus]|nr:hypothetical protein LTR66_013966 [Elasticomyces elasticus]
MARPTSGSKTDSILSFSEHIASSLQARSIRNSSSLPDVSIYLPFMPIGPVGLDKEQKCAIKSTAVHIWNAVNNFWSRDAFTKQKPALAQLRAFAFPLLCSAIRATARLTQATVQHFTRAVAVIKECLEADLCDLARQLLDGQATLYESLSKCDVKPSGIEGCGQLAAQYRCLQLLLAWRSAREDVADVRYCQMSEHMSELDEESALDLGSLLLEIGQSCIDRGNGEAALKWLERVDKLLQSEICQSVADADTDQNVTYALARVKFMMPGQVNKDLAWKYLQHALDASTTFKLPLHLLGLELSLQPGIADVASAYNYLETIIDMVHIIPSTHQLILHFCKQIAEQRLLNGSELVSRYLKRRLIRLENRSWVNDAVLAHVETFCKYNGLRDVEGVGLLASYLNVSLEVADGLEGVQLLSSSAQAAHAMLWTKVQQASNTKQHSLCMQLCQLALRNTFVNNIDLARKLLGESSFKEKDHPLSRFLSYCIDLRSGDEDAAESCLNTIANSQDANDKLLLACAGESMQHSKPLGTAKVLQRIFDKAVASRTSDLDLVALLKQIVSFLLEASQHYTNDEHMMEAILTRFCAAVRHACKMRDRSTHLDAAKLPVADARWFADLSYSQAQKHIRDWPAKHIVDLLHYSAQLLGHDDGVANELMLDQQHQHRSIEVEYFQAILYAAEARKVYIDFTVEDLPQTSFNARLKPASMDCRLVLYKHVYQKFVLLHSQYKAELVVKTGTELECMLTLLHNSLPLAFEALLFMNASACADMHEVSFDELSTIRMLQVASGLDIAPMDYATYVDIVLTFAMGTVRKTPQAEQGLLIPKTAAVRLICKVIQILRQLQDFSIEQAARWLRCIVQLIIEDIEQIVAMADTRGLSKATASNLAMLDSLIQQMNGIAQLHLPAQQRSLQVEANPFTESNSTDAAKSQAYPQEELEWTATKLFNLAIDFYTARHVDLARTWADKAVEVASLFHIPDLDCDHRNFDLAGVLNRKIQEMDWNVQVEDTAQEHGHVFTNEDAHDVQQVDPEVGQASTDDYDFDVDMEDMDDRFE